MKIMLDSGAFTAYQQKVSINLSDYIAYCQENARFLESYVNLDVIPSTDNPQGWEEAAKQSDRNYQRMKKEGLTPIPVYHFGERRYWLDKLVQEGVPRIGLGGIARRKSSDKRQWLLGCFRFFKSYPRVRVHGFGISSLKLLNQFPWDTADSTTWVIQGGLGEVFIRNNNKLHSIHLESCTPEETRWIRYWCQQQKVDYHRLRKDCILRSRMNIRAMQEFNRLFYFSLSTNEQYFPILQQEKAPRLLLSYYNLLNRYKRTIRDFAEGK